MAIGIDYRQARDRHWLASERLSALLDLEESPARKHNEYQESA
jgi:hypothetical protein